MTIPTTSTNSLPLLLRLFEPVRPDHGHYQVHLHQLLLLVCHICVGVQLLLDALAEFVPV